VVLATGGDSKTEIFSVSSHYRVPVSTSTKRELDCFGFGVRNQKVQDNNSLRIHVCEEEVVAKGRQCRDVP